MDAFDADVLIYAAEPEHHLGRRVVPLLAGDAGAAVGSILAQLELFPLDDGAARLAVALGATYRLRVADAVHLATAVLAGADRFVTNRRDVSTSITEIDVVYPAMLPEP